MARRKKKKSAKRSKNPVYMGGYDRAQEQLLRSIKTDLKDVSEFIAELEEEPQEPEIKKMLGKMKRAQKKLEDAEEILEE